MTLFVTGATGFIGRHIVRLLLSRGHSVRALVRPNSRDDVLQPGPSLRFIRANLAEIPTDELHGCDAMLHLAAHGVAHGGDDWHSCFRANVTDSMSSWLRAADAGIEHFVICGSCFEYGESGARYEFIPVDAPLEPTGAYHSSKAAASMAALGFAVDKRVKLQILRPFHVFGEGEHPERFWPKLRQAALTGQDFPMTAAEQVRDFIPVAQVAATFVSAITERNSIAGKPEIRNLGTGRPQTLRDFATYWWRAWNAQGRLLVGALPYRKNETMRYVPEIGARDR